MVDMTKFNINDGRNFLIQTHATIRSIVSHRRDIPSDSQTKAGGAGGGGEEERESWAGERVNTMHHIKR